MTARDEAREIAEGCRRHPDLYSMEERILPVLEKRDKRIEYLVDSFNFQLKMRVKAERESAEIERLEGDYEELQTDFKAKRVEVESLRSKLAETTKAYNDSGYKRREAEANLAEKGLTVDEIEKICRTLLNASAKDLAQAIHKAQEEK